VWFVLHVLLGRTFSKKIVFFSALNDPQPHTRTLRYIRPMLTLDVAKSTACTRHRSSQAGLLQCTAMMTRQPTVSSGCRQHVQNAHCCTDMTLFGQEFAICRPTSRVARYIIKPFSPMCPPGCSSRCRTLISVCDQPISHPRPNSAFHPSWVSKWVPASAGKAEAGMVHSVSGWTRGVQVKLRDPWEHVSLLLSARGVFTTRCYTNPRLPYLLCRHSGNMQFTFW